MKVMSFKFLVLSFLKQETFCFSSRLRVFALEVGVL
jgi:hypothetical protein